MRWLLVTLVGCASSAAAPAPAGSVRVAPGTPTVQGGLSVDVVKRVIAYGRGQIRLCYEQAWKKKPSLAGQLVVQFLIGADGHVTTAQVTQKIDPDLDDCVASHIRRWEFPTPSGGSVSVSAPFTLSPPP